MTSVSGDVSHEMVKKLDSVRTKKAVDGAVTVQRTLGRAKT